MWNVRSQARRSFLCALVLFLSACQSVQPNAADTQTLSRLYRFTQGMELLQARDPAQLVKGAEAERNLRAELSARETLVFIEEGLVSEQRTKRKVAAALIKVNSRRINEKTYLQLSPHVVGLEPVAMEVDLENPEGLIQLMSLFREFKQIEVRLSDSYQVNQEDTVAGTAYRVGASGRLETIRFDRFLVRPWADEREISEDLGLAERARKRH